MSATVTFNGVETLIQFGWLALGLVLLVKGADWLVKGSADLALKIGITPLVVGLTVVAFGTSAPELIASLKANLLDPPQGGLALGNVIGSNICNIGLVLGFTALLRPLPVDRQVIVRDMPILLLASVVFLLFLRDGVIERWEGVVFAVGVVTYTLGSLFIAKKRGVVADTSGELDEEEIAAAQTAGPRQVAFSVLTLIVGLGLLVLGADLLVSSGLELARTFGVPEAVIGLTMIALGTSLPELATSIVAARKGEIDIITGNAIGSCVFNLLAVVGITAAVAPIVAVDISQIDLAVMMAVTVGVLVLGIAGKRLDRWQGGLLLLVYLAYSGYLAAQSAGL